MTNEYEGTAIDSSVFEEIGEQPEAVTEEETPAEEVAVESVDSPEGGAVEEEAPNDKIIVDGVGEFTAEELKELKQAGLRQSDYTKKTQELARLREEAKDALNLLNHLRSNPDLVEALKTAELNPDKGIYQPATRENEMLQELAYNQKSMEVDMKINQLKQKYGDVNEIALFEKAAELRTDDFEFIHKALMYDNNTVDKKALIAEAKKELQAELAANKDGVRTTVSSTSPTPLKTTRSLTEDELRVSAAMGMSEDEYLKWQE